MNKSQLVNQDSGNYEYYTPPEIIEAARSAMGTIDLDPFSSPTANRVVNASEFYSSQGFERDWHGNVWCNHPFSRDNNKRIFHKAISEHDKGNISAICMITFAATSEAWFKPSLAYPQCFLHGRTNFFLPDGTKKKGVTKGSVITYIGGDVTAFYEAFKELGTVKVPYEGYYCD